MNDTIQPTKIKGSTYMKTKVFAVFYNADFEDISKVRTLVDKMVADKSSETFADAIRLVGAKLRLFGDCGVCALETENSSEVVWAIEDFADAMGDKMTFVVKITPDKNKCYVINAYDKDFTNPQILDLVRGFFNDEDLLGLQPNNIQEDIQFSSPM